MQIKIINKSKHPLPKYSTAYSAGMDLRANINEEISLLPQDRTPTPYRHHAYRQGVYSRPQPST